MVSLIEVDTIFLVKPSDWSNNNRNPSIEIKDGVVNVYGSLDKDATGTTDMSIEIADFGTTGHEMRRLAADLITIYCESVSGTPVIRTTFVQED